VKAKNQKPTPIYSVAPTEGPTLPPERPPVGENKWGVMGTPAVHPALGRLFVGLGGYVGIGDQDKTPFLRALDWDTLQDAWATTVGPDGVARYTTTTPPMYRSREAGLSSPAVVNDVMFISTSKPALYALDTTTGLCLWSAPEIPAGDQNEPTFALGPAVYGNYVVLGAWNNVYIYRLPAAWMARRQESVDTEAELALRWPPDPRILEVVHRIVNGP
jgi:outer membrane protein assembly factor BamB